MPPLILNFGTMEEVNGQPRGPVDLPAEKNGPVPQCKGG